MTLPTQGSPCLPLLQSLARPGQVLSESPSSSAHAHSKMARRRAQLKCSLSKERERASLVGADGLVSRGWEPGWRPQRAPAEVSQGPPVLTLPPLLLSDTPNSHPASGRGANSRLRKSRGPEWPVGSNPHAEAPSRPLAWPRTLVCTPCAQEPPLHLPGRARGQPPTHDAAGEADAPQAGAHVVPHADAAPADPLAHRQLQEEERDPDDDQQHQVGHQVGACGGGRGVTGCLALMSSCPPLWSS